MKSYKESAEIIRREQLASDIYRFTVSAPDIAAAAIPGQFVMVRVAEVLDPLLRRPFSIHQVTGGGAIQILIKVVGKGTQLLAGMAEGDKMDVLGPVGRGFSIAGEGMHCLVGGGIGIAPLLFLAEHILKKHDPSSVQVLLGARTGDELERLAEDFSAMGFAVSATTEDGSFGRQGLVTDLMTGLQQDKPVTVYGCGPYPMLKAVARVCRDKGWPCQVSMETIMACGLEACLGCAVPQADMKGYVHVCKDGPVFAMDEVAWL